MKNIILSASILSANFATLGEDIRSAEKAGIDWIHVDVMDGSFVPNISMGPLIADTCRSLTKLPIDAHLMVNHSERHIDAFVKAGVDYLTIHIENNPNIYRNLEHIRSLGCHPAVALNPGTPASSIEAILPLVDMVLIMTVNPGYSGQSFIENMCSKISQVDGMIRSLKSNAVIQVDGGINPVTLPKTFRAGARIFVAATAIFKHPQGISAGIESLRGSIDKIDLNKNHGKSRDF
jgi:ribulose-phosphate 3-epimerase